jgi:hypothetical protein
MAYQTRTPHQTRSSQRIAVTLQWIVVATWLLTVALAAIA